MGISISYISEFISYDTAVSVIVALIVLLVFILSDYYYNNENKERDEKLFKQPPPQFEDCPICFLRLPSLRTGYRYMGCCGKQICSGCIHASGLSKFNQKCPFCRAPHPKSNEEIAERDKKRVEAGDPIAIFNHGNYYSDGRSGHRQDHKKALELYHRAAELSSTEAYCNIGFAYHNGHGVELDKKKARQYYELAAMRGNADARYNLGVEAQNSGNVNRALKHHMIAARDGNNDSLKRIKEMYSNGRATKDDYIKALQLYQTYLGEIKSNQRDKAAAAVRDEFRYY